MLRLSDVAREVVVPEGIVTTGWGAVESWWSDKGVKFDAWQRGAGQVALGKREGGTYAATVGGVVLSIPRQVGKTFFVGALVVALCCMFPGLTVVWTAHRTRTSTMTFQTLQGLVSKRAVKPFVASVRQANGEQEIRFGNGSVVMFGAREQGFGRGFDEVDIEVFDEAQILTEKAMEDMVPATNQSRFPAGALLFFMGTPPRPADPSDVFSKKRANALDGKSLDTAYVEFSADQDADPDDWDQVAKANPSFPDRTPREAILRMRENLPSDESFLREGLGIWQLAGSNGVIPLDAWEACLDMESVPVGRFALGVEVGRDMESASVCLAGQRADGRWHVELDESRKGAAWIVGHVAHMVRKNPGLQVAGDVGGPLKALLDEREGQSRGRKVTRYFFQGTDVELHAPRVTELGVATAKLLSGVMTGQVAHIGQPQLTSAVAVAGKRPLADTGMWVFSRKTAVADISAVQAATSALWWSQSMQKKADRPRSSGREAVVL